MGFHFRKPDKRQIKSKVGKNKNQSRINEIEIINQKRKINKTKGVSLKDQ